MESSDESDAQSTMEEEPNKDEERNAIRAQLSTMSFEDLQKLKERVGAKVYKEALFGVKNKKETAERKVFKRENKNRPREMSAKKPVKMLANVNKVKKKEIRDPRFDPLCGEFDKKQFSENYNFLSDMRMNDIKKVRAELKQTTDPERVAKLKRLLQRLNDQHKANKRNKKEIELHEKRKQDVEQQFLQGRKPQFRNKSEMRVEALVKQYEELKKEGEGRVQRHLKRRQQKIKKRSYRPPVQTS